MTVKKKKKNMFEATKTPKQAQSRTSRKICSSHVLNVKFVENQKRAIYEVSLSDTKTNLVTSLSIRHHTLVTKNSDCCPTK